MVVAKWSRRIWEKALSVYCSTPPAFSHLIDHSTQQTASFSLFFIILYFSILVFKAWVVLSLGKFWNTKIYHISNLPLVKKGPYNYLKHPNYVVVIAEIAVIPLAFYLYFTAITFTILNAMMLFVRIKEENRALRE